MRKNNHFLLLAFFSSLLLVSLVSSLQTVNYSTPASGESSMSVTQLRYEPFPVNPGEYFDLYVQAQQGSGGSSGAWKFELSPKYPFSLDSNEDPVRTYNNLAPSEVVVLHYKIRVSPDAVEGVNPLDLKYSNGISGVNVKTFDISVNNAQTDFDLVPQQATGSDVSIAVANIGKVTANSLIVRVPEQNNFRTSGTNGQMVGNLAAGDYTIVSFSLTSSRAVNSSSRGSFGGLSGSTATNNNRTLIVQLDYTDSIGKRRSVIKQMPVFVSNTNSTSFGGRAGMVAPASSTSIFKSFWFWLLVIVLVLGYYFYRKNPSKFKSMISSSKSVKSDNRTHNDPDWVVSERSKKK